MNDIQKELLNRQEGSLLDEIAMRAMQSLIHNMAIADKQLAVMQREYYVKRYGEDVTGFEAIAKESYAMANEMVKERNNLKSK